MKGIKNIVIIIAIAVMALIGTLVFLYSNNSYETDFSKNWDLMKGDFHVVNEYVIDYFENNDAFSIDIKSLKELMNDDDDKESLERASDNYSKYNDYGNKITKISYKNGVVEYYDWEGNGYLERVVYSKYSKSELEKMYNTGERHYVIEELGDNWYYFDEHHL